MKRRTQIINKERGQLSLQMLIVGIIAVILLTGFLVWVDSFVKSAIRFEERASAFTVAEAGIEYYRWHLAHNSTDYQDGTATSGPYVHPYYNKDGVEIGTFSLDITPPPVGSTVVVIRSTGSLINNPGIEKIIEVKMAIPSFAKFAAVVKANVRFGAGTEVFGEIHSNGGIRFDGLAHNLVTSGVATYTDGDYDACTSLSHGVHTCLSPADPSPPTPVQSRPSIFEVGRNFPVPEVDFAGITQDLAQIASSAETYGFYRASSTALGYDVVLKTNDTFDLYKVTALDTPPSGCTNSQGQDGWGTWSIKTETLLGNYPLPGNGLIFLGDDVWVRGQINTARVTIASARFPDTSKSSITINANLEYTNTDGQDVIGLIAQKNINIGWKSADTLQVDAALIAQSGRVGRYYYRPPSWSSNRCSPYHVRNTITSNGMIGSSQRYGFAYTDGTGYITRNLVYDANLLFGPPPSFPLTSENYDTISWEELK